MDAIADSSASPRRIPRWGRIAIVVAGIILGQVVLYGPSLVGIRALLPLDILTMPQVYLPRTPQTRGVVPHNPILSDPVDYGLYRVFPPPLLLAWLQLLKSLLAGLGA